MRNPTQQAILDDIFAQADFDRRLFALRAAHPHLAYELDELARVFQRARDRVAAALVEHAQAQAPSPASSSDALDWNREETARFRSPRTGTGAGPAPTGRRPDR